MRLLFTSLISLLLQFTFAQNATVRGNITDAATGEPLIGATINAGPGLGAASDASGNYSVSLKPGRYDLTFSIVGYTAKTQSIRLDDGQSLVLDMTLSDADNLLQTATVTSGKFEKALGEVTVSLDVVKPKLIASTNANSVDDVLGKVPGVNVVDGQVNIRGGSGFSYGAGTRVLLLVDDIPALQADAGFPNWDDIAVENVSQIEVLKGAASALYGSSAMNGIINIRTGYATDAPETEAAIFGKIWGAPKDAAKQWWGRDTSGLQQPYESGFSIVHREKIGKFDLVLGAYGLIRDSYNRSTYSRYGRITPNFRYRITNRLTLGLNTNFNMGRSGSFFIWGGDGINSYQAGLGSASKSNGRFRYNIDPSLQYFDAHGFRHKLLGRFYSVHNNNSGNQSNDSRMIYSEYQIQKQIERIHLVVTAGAVGIFNKVDAALYNNGIYTTRNLAGYLQADWKVLKRLNLSGGVRYEQNRVKGPDTIRIDANNIQVIPNGESKESKPVFRLGANYQIAKATYLRASWGQGYRYPTIAEKFISTDFSTISVVRPNPKLVSETGWTAELGLKHGFRVGEWQGFVDVTGFVSEYQKMMEFVLAAVFPKIAFESQNTGDTRIKGIELSVQGQGKLLGGTVTLLTGFTGIDPKYKDFDKNTIGSSSDVNVLKYRYRKTFKFDAEYARGRFAVGVSTQYNSHMQAIDALFEGALPGVKSFRDSHNKGFTLTDLRLSYKLTKTWKVSFLCGNLLNEEYSVRPALLEGPRNYTLRIDKKW